MCQSFSTSLYIVYTVIKNKIHRLQVLYIFLQTTNGMKRRKKVEITVLASRKENIENVREGKRIFKIHMYISHRKHGEGKLVLHDHVYAIVAGRLFDRIRDLSRGRIDARDVADAGGVHLGMKRKR